MEILFFEICNYRDYPLGGHLTFAKQMAKAIQGKMDLVGCTTDRHVALRKWKIENIEGYEYRIFYLCHEKNSTMRPLIPRRITVWKNVKRYTHLLHWERYDCIVVQTPEVLLALPKRILSKVCLVMPGMGNPLSISRYPMARHFTEIYDKLFFAYAQYCPCVLAAADKKSIDDFIARSRGKASHKTIIQFPTRYDADIFKVKDKWQIRKKYGYNTDITIFITTGRLNWFKGWKLMLDAYLQYIKKTGNVNSKFIFVGEGEEYDRIKEYVSKLQIEENVEINGRKPLNEVAEYLAMSDEFVMGSFSEGWSTSLVEAVACGLPCVVTNFSSAREMVKDGVNGFVIGSRDEKIFSQRMAEALNLSQEKIKEASMKIQRLSVQNLRNDFESTIHRYFVSN